MNKHNIRAMIPACATVLCGAASGLEAATTDAAGYTPIMYVYQKNELVDVKTFKVADLGDCQRRASALLELYLNHSDIEDDMRLVVRCVPVPPPSAGHRKGERSSEAEHHQRSAEVTL
ncbi:MAG TPA: hypothetical protein VMT66_07115 [Steroidobacteraceae bacterium]|nr:hypothetical protein [Steroidobacteraceae bacterium]